VAEVNKGRFTIGGKEKVKRVDLNIQNLLQKSNEPTTRRQPSEPDLFVVSVVW